MRVRDRDEVHRYGRQTAPSNGHIAKNSFGLTDNGRDREHRPALC